MTKEETKKSTQKNVTKKTPTKKSVPTNKKAQKTKVIPKIVQEENDYGKTILAAILIVIVLIGSYFLIQSKNNEGAGNEASYVQTADEKKFQEEYESLNGTKRSNGKDNKEISIIADNNIEYIDMKKASEILNNGSGVIYFGFAACPWCRNSVPVLLEAMTNSELDKIYYVNVRSEDKTANDLRGSFKANEKGNKAVVEFPSAEGYSDVLKALDSYLSDYTITGKNGKKLSTGEKRLGAPTVVVVKDGRIIDFHAGTISGHEKDANGVLRDLTKEEKNTLLERYTNMISKYLEDACPVDGETC